MNDELDVKAICDAIKWCIRDAGDAKTVTVRRDILEVAVDFIDATSGERTCELEFDTGMERVKCSACGKAIPYGANLLEVKYCPNCGAKVVSDDD